MGPNILIVDDEAAVLSMLTAIMQTQGYRVTGAHSAHEAQKLLSEASFDLVLTDMKMESPTAGYDVAQAAARQPYAPMVVILTAYPLIASDWKQSGAHAMLAKPSGMNSLLDTVSQLLARRQHSTGPAPKDGTSVTRRR